MSEKQYEYLIKVPVKEFHTYWFKVTASNDEEAIRKYEMGDTDREQDEYLDDDDDGELVIVSKKEIKMDEDKKFRYTFEVPVWKCYMDEVDVYADSKEEALQKLKMGDFEWADIVPSDEWFDFKAEPAKAELLDTQENIDE